MKKKTSKSGISPMHRAQFVEEVMVSQDIWTVVKCFTVKNLEMWCDEWDSRA